MDPAEDRFVEAAGIRWHVLRHGAGAPAWLFLHGTGASAHSWQVLLGTARPWPGSAWVVELPGHGRSGGAAPAQLTLPGMAGACSALLSTLGVSPQVVVGHSAGAALAVRLVLDGLASPRALVSINGAFLPFGGVAAPLLSPLARLLWSQRWVPQLFARRAEDPAVVRRLVEGTGSRLDDAGIEAYRALMRQPGQAEAALGMMAHWDLRGLALQMRQLALPMLLLAGSADRAVPPRQAARLAAQVPEARLVVLPGLGHLAHEEDPTACWNAIQPWIAAALQHQTVPEGRQVGARV